MNRSHDVELVLRDYFSDDSSPAPDHVLDVMLNDDNSPDEEGQRLERD